MTAQNHESSIEFPSTPLLQPEKLPRPTAWPAALALGATLMAFGVLTSLILSAFGGILFLVSAYGWVEEMRNDLLL